MNKILIFMVIFLVIGGYMIVSNLDLNLHDEGDQKTFAKGFGKWLLQLGKSTKETVGYAVKQDWLPQNATNITQTK